jgi:cell division protein FtsQ
MLKPSTRKKPESKNRQAIRGKKIKRRNYSKAINFVLGKSIFLWRPKLIVVMVALTLILFAYRQIDLQQVLPIRSVKIEGEFDFLDKNQLRKQALPVVNGGFFSVNLPVVRNELVKLPWVEDVSVRLQWPDRLLVRVIEKKPVVLWGDNGVVSAKGVLFVPEKKAVLKLPHLSGPEGQHKTMLHELARMQAWLLDTGLFIQNIELNARRSWILTMTTGMELRLGREQMHERLNRFVSVYNDALKRDKREIKYIDMRYTNGFSVAWKEA